MATSFVKQATSQLAPAYQQQVGALQSQIPAIQQLYESLNQGLLGQQQAGNQNILEDASGRGLLHSTIPIQGQIGLGQQVLQQQGINSANQARDVGNIQGQIAGLGTDQAQAIAQLANALAQSQLGVDQFAFQKAQAAKDYALQKKIAAQQYKLGLKAAKAGY